MTPDVAIVAERIRQRRAALVERLAPLTATSSTTEQRMKAPHQPGDTVFDPVTGERGIIVAATRQTVVVQNS